MQASSSSSLSALQAGAERNMNGEEAEGVRSAVWAEDNGNNEESNNEGSKHSNKPYHPSGSEGSSGCSPLTPSTGGGSGRQEASHQQQHMQNEVQGNKPDSAAEAPVASALSATAPVDGQFAACVSQSSESQANAAYALSARVLRFDPVVAAPAAANASEGSETSRLGTSRRVAHTLQLQPVSLSGTSSSHASADAQAERSDGAPPVKRLRLSLTATAAVAASATHRLDGPPTSSATSASSLSTTGGGGRGRVLRLLPITAASATPRAAETPPEAPAEEKAVSDVAAKENEEEPTSGFDAPQPLVSAAANAGQRAPSPLSYSKPSNDPNVNSAVSNTPAAPAGVVDEKPLGAVHGFTRPAPLSMDPTFPANAVGRNNSTTPPPPVQPAPSPSSLAMSGAGSPPGPTAGPNAFPRGRPPTPQPYSTSAQGSPGRRRHRFVNVNVPPAPPPSQRELLNSFQRTVMDVYDVQEKLSEGTYGEVFKGVDKRTGAQVALKRLKMLSTHQGFPQTSLREVIALRHIQNQRERLEARLRQGMGAANARAAVADPLAEVAQLCDVLVFSRQQPDIVLVFAYASASLAGLLRRQFVFSPTELAYLIKKLVTAVRKLHEMSIIHRDIKSDNVLITSEGEVQLTDFGLCSIVGSGGRAWRTPSVITLAYRPPEMLLGSTAYDEKVDVWSVGCLLAQLYLFEPPFYRHRALQQQGQQQQQQQPQRTAATELEQLSRIAEVLGPLPPVAVFHPDACQHMQVLKQIEQQGRLAEKGAAAPPANWGKLQSLFAPSFLFQQFHGFRGWFEAEVQRTRHQPPRRPTQACMDVLCAALQLDPQQRPSAAELLRMPYFTTLDDAPLGGSFHRLLAVTPEREEEVRRGFMLKVQRCGDSHTQRRPH